VSGYWDIYLIAAELGETHTFGFCINKFELMDKDLIAAGIWQCIPYTLNIPDVLHECSRKGIGIKELAAGLNNHSTVLSGPSGVGKSSLINAISGEDCKEPVK
jgi:putative ribosome biogenesis GTPase RsgA